MARLYMVDATSLYARTGPQSWCIGYLFKGDYFEIEGGTNNWAWGRTFGRGFQGRCWVRKKDLRPRPPKEQGSPGVRFSIDRIAASRTAARGILERGEDHPHLTIHVEVKAKLATLYGNYWKSFAWYPSPSSVLPFGTGLHDPLMPGEPLHRGHGLGWRYTVWGGRAAMVFDYKNKKWGFIHRAHIETPQRDKYYFEFAKDPKNRGKNNPYHREPVVVRPELA